MLRFASLFRVVGLTLAATLVAATYISVSRAADDKPAAAPAEKAKPSEEKPGSGARALWGGKASSGSTAANTAPASAPGGATGRPKKGRASMPSWDEIVFGARSDDDLA